MRKFVVLISLAVLPVLQGCIPLIIGGAIGVGMQGYRALTREDLAARIVVQPIGPQMFSATVLSGQARTLEDLVQDMLRPMLKSWLDENLPGMVERLVRAEIERVTRGGR